MRLSNKAHIMDSVSRYFFEINKVSPYNTTRLLRFHKPIDQAFFKRVVDNAIAKQPLLNCSIYKHKDKSMYYRLFDTPRPSKVIPSYQSSSHAELLFQVKQQFNLDESSVHLSFYEDKTALITIPHYISDGGGFQAMIQGLISQYSTKNIANEASFPLSIPYSQCLGLVDQGNVLLTQKNSDHEFSSSLDYFCLELSNPPNKRLHPYVAAACIHALRDTLNVEDDDPSHIKIGDIFFKSPIAMRSRAGVENSQIGNFLRQIYQTVPEMNNMEATREFILNDMKEKLSNDSFVSIPTVFPDDSDCLKRAFFSDQAEFAFSNLGSLKMPLVKKMITLSSVIQGPNQLFANGHVLNGSLQLAFWYNPDFWPENRLSIFKEFAQKNFK